ncbi:Retrovirus-related Pol polyprotein from transposon RE1, partial [Fagus crenata]
MAESEQSTQPQQSTQPPTITSLPANSPHNLVNLISINATAQLPLKLSPSNYLSWRAQFHTLLVGYDLLGYLDGSLACPLRSVVTNGISTVNPAYTFWLRQDQLLLHAIIASVSESITPFVASSQTSREAWDRLSTLYASRSRTRIMHLKDKLALITRGTKSISEYLQTIKSAADELALAGVPQSNDDLLLYSLRGLGSEYKEIVAAIRARDTPISFEELHDKLLEQEVYLKREASQSEPSHITANATRTYSQPKPSNNRRNEKNHFSQNRGPPHQRNQFFQGPSPHPDPRSNFKRPPPNQHNPNRIVCQYCGKHASHGHSTSLDNTTSSSCNEPSVPHVPSPPPQSSHPSPTTEPPIASRIHPKTTRSQNNIFKP